MSVQKKPHQTKKHIKNHHEISLEPHSIQHSVSKITPMLTYYDLDIH